MAYQLRGACLAASLLAAFVAPHSVNASENTGAPTASIKAPILSSKGTYSEYYEQQFLFDTDAVATSQFLIANLPFSKHHGMQVATLKEPNGETIVVKNGRKKSGWNHQISAPGEAPILNGPPPSAGSALSIFQHRLWGAAPKYQLRLHNTAAELDVDFTAAAPAIPIVSEGNPLNLPTVTLYAPTASADGRWRPGPEIDGPGPDGPWHALGGGFGYGLHVVQSVAPNKVLKRWQRVVARPQADAATPIFHGFETPNGETHFVLYLLSPSGALTKLDVTGFEGLPDSNQWQLTASASGLSLTGTVELGSQIEQFNLKDQLNALEKVAAGSMVDVNRLRYAARYELTLVEDGVTTPLSGRAIAEDIQMGKSKAKRKRRRTRR